MKILVIAALLLFNGYTIDALTCADGQFKCGDGSTCVHNSWKCDGTNDCTDGTDEQGCALNTCVSSSLFLCKNGQCILSSWKCDGQDDCGDDSDETTETCPKEESCQFQCKNTKCLAPIWVCDKYDDCGDNSDEENCDQITTTPSATTTATTITTQPTTIETTTTPRPTTMARQSTTTSADCLPGEFQCLDNKMCILKSWKCDQFRDCGDSSDETGCDTSTSPPTTKVPTTIVTEEATTTRRSTTPRSIPLRGLSDRSVCDKDQFLCATGSCTFKTWRCDGDNDCGDNSDEKNCENTDPIVLPTLRQNVHRTSCSRNQFQCVASSSCIHNNWVCDQERDCKDGSDEFQCVTNPTIIMATKSTIQKISENLDTSEDFLKRHSGTVAIDVDIHTQFVYWSDIKRKEIRRASLNDRSSQVVVLSGLGLVEGIAIDWIARKLYWTDSLASTIGVSGLRGENKRELIRSHLDKPRGIAVHPSGYIFWTEWGAKPRLSRCSMDGKPGTRRTIIDKDIIWPNAVTIDYTTNTLWWADAKLRKIEHCNLDGSNRHVISDVGYPFSLAVSSVYVYWTNWETNTIDRIGKDTSYQHAKKSRKFKEHPLGISLYDGRKHAAVHSECTTNNGGCSHLCLLSSERDHFSCQCPDRMQLGRDSKICTSRVENACSSKHFRCDRGLCIAESRKCDGVSDCMDSTDEHYCLTHEPRLVYGNLKSYVAISGLTPGSAFKEISKAKSVTGIDIDVKNGYVFWADTAMNSIMKTALSSNGDVISSEALVDTYVFTPEGLSFDWITNKIYWIDSQLLKIEVVDVEKKHRYVVLDERLGKPRAIVVHPKNRRIYWSDWGARPYIATIAMDGDPDTRYNLVDNSGIRWPNGLTIDYDTDTLYWADAFYKKIEQIHMYGGKRKAFMREVLSHPFSLTFYKDFVYWSDWGSQKIYKVNKDDTKVDSIVRTKVAIPMGLAIFDRDRQKNVIRNPCAVFNGGCSHLCLLSSNSKKYTCRCPKNLSMSKDGKTCINLYTTTQRSETNSLLDIGVI